MSVQDNRLTRAEYAAIDARLSERIGDLTKRTPSYRPAGWEWQRLAWHAIGCDDRDLRDVELVLIGQQVEAICEHYGRLVHERVMAVLAAATDVELVLIGQQVEAICEHYVLAAATGPPVNAHEPHEPHPDLVRLVLLVRAVVEDGSLAAALARAEAARATLLAHREGTQRG